MSENLRKRASQILLIAFYTGLFYLILTSFKPLPVKAHPILLKSLLSGSDFGYIIPGSEFEPFKSVLPKRGKISFISQRDPGISQEEEKLMYDAQNYLAPLLLNPEPAQSIAIIYTSDHESAQNRLTALNYDWVQEFSPGKGVARKR